MTVGDVVSSLSPLAGSATLTIQPTGAGEWIIHNIYYSDSIDVLITDGAISCTIETTTEGGAISAMFFHLTNSQYMELINLGAGSINAGYDGVISK